MVVVGVQNRAEQGAGGGILSRRRQAVPMVVPERISAEQSCRGVLMKQETGPTDPIVIRGRLDHRQAGHSLGGTLCRLVPVVSR
jgi:hypothetical protein